jgi:hypothetical protein
MKALYLHLASSNMLKKATRSSGCSNLLLLRCQRRSTPSRRIWFEGSKSQIVWYGRTRTNQIDLMDRPIWTTKYHLWKVQRLWWVQTHSRQEVPGWRPSCEEIIDLVRKLSAMTCTDCEKTVRRRTVSDRWYCRHVLTRTTPLLCEMTRYHLWRVLGIEDSEPTIVQEVQDRSERASGTTDLA